TPTLHPRHPDSRHSSGGAPLSGAVSVRPARDRDSSRALVTDPARLRTQFEAEEIGPEVREHLVPGGLPAEGAHREAGELAAQPLRVAGFGAAHGRLCHALR